MSIILTICYVCSEGRILVQVSDVYILSNIVSLKQNDLKREIAFSGLFCFNSIINGLTLVDFVQVVAEIIGTYFLIFIGCGSVVIDKKTNGSITHMGVSIVWGLVVMIIIYSIGHISGAHLNPAVTLAFAVVRRFPWTQVCEQYI